MKIATLTSLSIIMFSCHSQEKDRTNSNQQKDTVKPIQVEIPINPKTMETYTTERFDIKNYFKFKNKQEAVYVYFRDDGAKILETDISSYSFFKYITPKGSLFTIQKEYYKNGLLKNRRETFGDNGFTKGIFYEYDERGKLIKAQDWDKPFKFTWEQVKKYCEEELKFDLLKDKVGIGNDLEYPGYDFPMWSITYLGKYKNEDKGGLIYILINGNTGELVKVTRQLGKGGEGTTVDILYDAKAEKKKADEEGDEYFTTYKGKKYTKKEWKAYEEEWYKSHQEKKNSKGFWDDLFKKP